MPGSDYEAVVRITFDQAFHGTEIDLELSALEWDPDGGMRRVPHRVRTRIPRGVTNGEKLRVPGKGGKGANGGPDGDLYLDIEVADHPLYRVSGNDLYVDLPLAPWEAVLGTSVELPTPGGHRHAQGPAGHARGTAAAPVGPRHDARQRRRRPPATRWCASRCRPSSTTRSKDLYRKLADTSNFDPRAQFAKEASR